MIETETGAETTTIATEEDLPEDTGADLQMITAAAVEATTTAVVMTMGLPEEAPIAHLLMTIRTTIDMDLRAHGAAIPMGHPAEGVAHRRIHVMEVDVIATAGTRAFREYHFWFATLAPTSPTTTSARHLDASVTFVMCISRGIITRSKQKALPLSNTPILIRLARRATKWTASISRVAYWKSYLHRNVARVRTK